MSNNEIREKRKKVICDLVKDDFYVPMKEKELAMFLQVSKEDREEFREILQELLAEGKLTLTVKGKYMKSNGKVLTGTFISNAKGFGFVEVEGRDEDLFIPEDKQGGAFHKDTVEVALLPAKTGKRQEAQVIRIIARGMTQVVGTYEQSKSNFGFVIPDNTKIAQDIFVPKEWSKGAMTGHKVVVEITGYGTNTKSPEGKVVEILGHINDPGVDIMSIVRGFDLPVEFGEKIMSQVERVSQEVSETDCAGRRDLRDVTMVTIDGEDAKDLDDAVSVSFDGTYYHLGVHIADVTNYVQENSALDREALKRGTSVYLVDRVIPMLPHALSNGICSLNEGVDRLALSCLMKVDEEGEIVDYEICESVIRVNKRMSYTVVKKLLEEPEWDPEAFKRALRDHWGIPCMTEPEDGEDGESTLVFEVEGMLAALSLYPFPVPHGEAEEAAGRCYLWPEAEAAARRHKGQLLVSVLGREAGPWKAAALQVKLVCAACGQAGTLGVYANGTVYPPELYQEAAAPLDEGELPLLNLVWVGLYRTEEGMGAYTDGLRSFGKDELEVLDARAEPAEVRNFLLNIADYLLEEDVTLRDGETIGFSEEQRLPITRSAGVGQEGMTLKIGWPGEV